MPDPISTTTQVEVPIETGGVHEAEKVAQTTQIVTVHHNPGSPLATQEDLDSSEAFEAELAAVAQDTRPDIPEYAGIDTTSAEANLASRSNIVSDGPGTTGFVPGA